MELDRPITACEYVCVTNKRSLYYGHRGIVERLGECGLGWYIRFEDGEAVYIPFGIERVIVDSVPRQEARGGRVKLIEVRLKEPDGTTRIELASAPEGVLPQWLRMPNSDTFSTFMQTVQRTYYITDNYDDDGRRIYVGVFRIGWSGGS